MVYSLRTLRQPPQPSHVPRTLVVHHGWYRYCNTTPTRSIACSYSFTCHLLRLHALTHHALLLMQVIVGCVCVSTSARHSFLMLYSAIYCTKASCMYVRTYALVQTHTQNAHFSGLCSHLTKGRCKTDWCSSLFPFNLFWSPWQPEAPHGGILPLTLVDQRAFRVAEDTIIGALRALLHL